MLNDIVPAIEGVMTVLPEPIQRPRNPEVRIRLFLKTMPSCVGCFKFVCFQRHFLINESELH